MQMPRYVCHKTVHALKVRTGPRNLGREYVLLTPDDKAFAPISVTETWCQERKVKDIGYYVVYEDGYTSWSPVEAFEKGYTPIADGIPDINSPGPIVEVDSPSSELQTLKAKYDLSREESQWRKTRIESLLSTLKNVQGILSKTLNARCWSWDDPVFREAQATITLIDSELVNSVPTMRQSLSASNPWVEITRSLVEALTPAYEDNLLMPFGRQAFEDAKKLLADGVSLNTKDGSLSVKRAELRQALAEWDTLQQRMGSPFEKEWVNRARALEVLIERVRSLLA